MWKKLLQQYEERGCIKTPEDFPPKKGIMKNIMENERRYGDFIYTKGEVTSLEGLLRIELHCYYFINKHIYIQGQIMFISNNLLHDAITLHNATFFLWRK